MPAQADDSGPGPDRSRDSPIDSAAAPVASLDGLGPVAAGPVASLDPGRLGAAPDIPVADLDRATGTGPSEGRGRVADLGSAGTGRPGRPGRRVRDRTGPTPPEGEQETARVRAAAGGARRSRRPDPARPAGRTEPDRTVSDPETDRTEADPEADPLGVARAICLRLLTERARSRHELAQALHRRGVPEDASRAVLDRFGEVGLIDDTAFAEQWVHSRHTGKGLARRALVVELRRKGVADDVAGAAVEEIDTGAEERRARQLVDRKLRGVPLDSPERRVAAARRLAGMLARKGYRAAVAYQVVREAISAHGAEPDELGLGDGPVG